MKKLITLLMLCTLSSLNSMTDNTGPAAPGTMRLMTWNVATGAVEDGLTQGQIYDLRWTARKPAIVGLMASLAPSVMGCQEPMDNQTLDIGLGLKRVNYSWYGEANKECTLFGKKFLSWVPVVFNKNLEYAPVYVNNADATILNKGTFWLSGEQWKAQQGADVVRICTWMALRAANGRYFNVLNTHLDNTSDALRIEGLQAILTNLPPADITIPTFIMGDFNRNLADPIGTIISQAGFADTRDLAQHVIGSDPTYVGWLGAQNGRIDHILVKNAGGITITQHNTLVPSEKLSDHYPVVVDWMWNQ